MSLLRWVPLGRVVRIGWHYAEQCEPRPGGKSHQKMTKGYTKPTVVGMGWGGVVIGDGATPDAKEASAFSVHGWEGK